ncbi:MAG TPA: helix-turn-helix transcriptional regulator [Pseudonocardiaceae bacterium]
MPASPNARCSPGAALAAGDRGPSVVPSRDRGGTSAAHGAATRSAEAARNYDQLPIALRELRDALGLSAADLVRRSGDRLEEGRVRAVLDGVAAATGEEFVLILRALGLDPAAVRAWVDTWWRLGGPRHGRPIGAAGRGPRIFGNRRGPRPHGQAMTG